MSENESNFTEERIGGKKRFPVWAIILIGIIAVSAIVLTSVLATGNAKSKKIEQQLELATKYLSELNYEQAIAVYEQIIKIDAKNVDAYIGMADVYVAMGDYESAKEVMSRAHENVEDEAAIEKLKEYEEEKLEKPEKDENEGAVIGNTDESIAEDNYDEPEIAEVSNDSADTYEDIREEEQSNADSEDNNAMLYGNFERMTSEEWQDEKLSKYILGMQEGDFFPMVNDMIFKEPPSFEFIKMHNLKNFDLPEQPPRLRMDVKYVDNQAAKIVRNLESVDYYIDDTKVLSVVYEREGNRLKLSRLYNADGTLTGFTYFTDYDADNNPTASYTEMIELFIGVGGDYLTKKIWSSDTEWDSLGRVIKGQLNDELHESNKYDYNIDYEEKIVIGNGARSSYPIASDSVNLSVTIGNVGLPIIIRAIYVDNRSKKVNVGFFLNDQLESNELDYEVINENSVTIERNRETRYQMRQIQYRHILRECEIKYVSFVLYDEQKSNSLCTLFNEVLPQASGSVYSSDGVNVGSYRIFTLSNNEYELIVSSSDGLHHDVRYDLDGNITHSTY